ncbi:uncharacterized protein N7515_004667 [Penicillium bovifimosum]|uniref:Uncharacterized protein n=1 Tax=Penicillium bovifimosum TaxID=126998 RepID=A0A9W9L476_9EURO|nr:uncharacterized protein N7515_004667 [Penicillium bovifimosum]KAJ5135389.1 hypothetical protein N7515_004667 [Penicillium bovifimosum]
MKRYQQHTHASWHRAYGDTVECPWCPEGAHRPETPLRPQSQTHRKNTSSRTESRSTHRTNATATPVGHRNEQGSRFEHRAGKDSKAGTTPIESRTPDRTRAGGDGGTPGQESVDENYDMRHLGRTAGQDGLNSAHASRPPLPEAWTRESEEPEHGSMAWSGSSAETGHTGLDTPGDIQVPGDDKIGSSELNVRELEESQERAD